MVLQVEVHDDGVVELVLDRPDQYNAIDPELRDALLDALEQAERDGVRCLLVRGHGRGFCAGMDLRAGGGHRGVDVTTTMRASSSRLAERFLTSPVPIVSAVHGVCAGIGLTLALGADHCVAADDARFVAAFLARSIVPDGGATRLLPRLVGIARARRMLLFGEEVRGAEAVELGLIGEATSEADLLTVARERARTLAAMPTQAIGLTKSLLARSFELDLATTLLEERVGQGLISTSHDYAEGVDAFVGKRPPEFTGR
jgi:2-(1,2-epoxy-1,2-dihydrophenyl)acetyl-CoA isomerase